MKNQTKNNESMNNNLSNNMKETKVVCPKCGAEFDVVANHEHMATGMVIGKDSGLGTVYLPTKDGRQQPLSEVSMEQKMQLLTSLGFDVNAFMSMAKSLGMQFKVNADITPEVANVTLEPKGYDEAEEEILKGDWIENAKLFRRFLPGATLQLLFGYHYGYDKTGRWSRLDGDHFTKWLHGQPDLYEWRVVINEFHAMAAMQRNGDKENLEIRSLIWNKETALGMLEDYMKTVDDFVRTSKVHTYKKRNDTAHGCYTYERIKYYKFHGVHNYITVDELDDKVYEPIRKAMRAITAVKAGTSGYYKKIEEILREFYKHVQIMPRRYHETATFANAFKAAGGYYTLEDFIRHNGWRITPRDHMDGWGQRLSALDRAASLTYLRDKLEECVKYEGYKMLGMLKQVAADNNFNYQATRLKWAEERRARQASKR